MATYVAVTVVRHGLENGERKEFQPGEPITGLPKEAMENLLAAEAIAKKEDWDRLNAPSGPSSSEVEDNLRQELSSRDEEIAKLKAALAEAEKKTK